MKIRIEKYQETLNGKPIDGYLAWYMWHNYNCYSSSRYEGQEWKVVQSRDDWEHLGMHKLPSEIFKKHNKHSPMGTVRVFEI